jgi:hypothetical protein
MIKKDLIGKRFGKRREQMANLRKSVYLTDGTEKACAAEWARRLNVCHALLLKYKNKGLSDNEIFRKIEERIRA